MASQVIDHRDPIALFTRLLTPVAEQLHAANLAMGGWVAHEIGVLTNNLKCESRFNRRGAFEVIKRYGGGHHIGVATTCGNVGSDTGVGVIFGPQVAMEIQSDDGKALDLSDEFGGDEKDRMDSLMTWLRLRYEKALVWSHQSNSIMIEFDREDNKIAAQ